MAGFQTTIGGSSPAKDFRVIGRGTGTPSPVSVVTTRPFTSSTTRSTLANWVSVYATWASRMRTDGMPPPDPNCGLRSTVAVPSAIDSPSSSVPSGTRLWTPASASATLGPASSDCIAARGERWSAEQYVV